MINRIYRLIDKRKIEVFQRELDLSADMPLIKPEYLSICAADQRYFMGKRPKEIMKKKLPMALIHEGTGVVVYDKSGRLRSGTRVVMVPNIRGTDDSIKENYGTDSRFMSSSCDGFMQDFVQMPQDRLIPLPDGDKVYVLCELMSIAFNAIDTVEIPPDRQINIGVWGDGKVGYASAIILKHCFPNARIYVFGVHAKKLQYFSFADFVFETDAIPDGLTLDVCFECVGGTGSGDAVEQIIKHIRPQGSIALLGVSEQPVPINTRMVLEKGLRLTGCSRSSREDFERAVKLLSEHSYVRAYMENIISETVRVTEVADIYHAFESDCINDFKTIMKWRI